PVVAMVATNTDPDDIDVIIPANDDAIRAISLIAGAMADAVIESNQGVVEAVAEESTDKAFFDNLFESNEGQEA
ncbi:MAG: 30S ribosomal protein S2, partial [Abiotrophia defectiva]|nr:30S ribosomal protein S2 [Abiotrophia defectiva]